MKIKPKSINVTPVEEKLQIPQSGYDMANKMRVIVGTIEMKVPLLNEMLSKVEPAVIGANKILIFNVPEYEALCAMLNSLKLLSTQGIKTADHILLLFDSEL